MKFIINSAFLLLLVQTNSARSSGFNYFDTEINFWSEGKSKSSQIAETSELVEKSESKKSRASKFDWEKHLNPENDEFFREGDYVPPAPFMELARRPTDENIRLWFKYLESKNQITERLQKKLAAFGQSELSLDRKTYTPEDRINPKSWRFTYFFDSRCPHCKRMFNTIYELQSHGFYVDVRQIDQNPVSDLKVVPSLVSKEELRALGITAVPYLIAENLTTGRTQPFNGYQDTNSIFEKL